MAEPTRQDLPNQQQPQEQSTQQGASAGFGQGSRDARQTGEIDWSDPARVAQEYFAGVPKPLPEEVLYEWRALSRPFKKRKRQYYTTIALIVFLISMILFFAGQFLPIAVVLAAAFLAYVMSAVEPQEARMRITTYGIRFDDQLYYWEELGRFWLDYRYEQRVVNLELGRFPNRLTLVIGDASEETIRDILSEVLLNEKPPLTAVERAANWLSSKIPLE